MPLTSLTPLTPGLLAKKLFSRVTDEIKARVDSKVKSMADSTHQSVSSARTALKDIASFGSTSYRSMSIDLTLSKRLRPKCPVGSEHDPACFNIENWEEDYPWKYSVGSNYERHYALNFILGLPGILS